MLGLSLATGALGGTGFNFADLLSSLDQYGFFFYILPFLLVFALVYAILSQIKMFKENKGAAVIIAIAIGFLSLVGDFVPTFFSTIFPRVGIGLAAVLAAMLLAGFFIVGENNGKTYNWIMFALGGLIFLFVIFSSLSSWSFYGAGNWSYWWDNYAGIIIFVLALVGVIVAVTLSNKTH